MSAAFPLTAAVPLRRQAWWLLIAIHVPFIAFTAAQAGLGLAVTSSEHDIIALPLVLLAAAIQLRHSLAAAAGMRPRYWPWTLLLLAAIAYAPAAVFGMRWATLQWFALASFAMLLRGRVALLAVVVSLVAHCLWYATFLDAPTVGPPALFWTFAYWGTLQFMGAGGLYVATRLVRLLDELHDARSDLAELAVGRERLRISRDLHDLLGQSLSAVSLKGDLAIGLLERGDVPRATGEIEGLVSVARAALRDVREIAQRRPPIALSSEIDRAVDLLASVGVETRVNVAAEPLSQATDELFAWALREGVTNVLRHSSATVCAIDIARTEGTARLEITNNGAMPVSSGGNGLSGLAARAAALSGSASGRPIADGSFRLLVQVPEVTAP
jgi:two-component system, NarL family, sensor histidine kinase DesK